MVSLAGFVESWEADVNLPSLLPFLSPSLLPPLLWTMCMLYFSNWNQRVIAQEVPRQLFEKVAFAALGAR